jgi:hypothetical protein
MRQKFEMNGDHVELILSYPGGDILRAPLATLLSMTTLNDGELARYSYQPPAPNPFDPDSPLPERVHCTIKVEITPEAEVKEALALAGDDEDMVHVITDPAAPPPPAVVVVRCSDCDRPCTSEEQLAEHRRYAHPQPRRIRTYLDEGGNPARVIGDGTGPASRAARNIPGGDRD